MLQELIEAALTAAGADWILLPRREARQAQRRWRATYRLCSTLAGRRWSRNDLEWHVFSFDTFPHLTGEAALAEYRKQAPAEFFVWLEHRDSPCFRCRGGTLPDFSAGRVDIHIFPADLAWTMAFTHEESLGLGPYFSRADWAPVSAATATAEECSPSNAS